MKHNGIRKHLARTLAVATLGLPVLASANNNFNQLGLLSQAQFATLSENLAAATSYKALEPAEPLGLLGFDLGLEVSGTEIDKEIFNIASQGGWDLSTLPVPKLHVHKGLPLNFDVGAFYTAVPNSDIKIWGGELRYAIIAGGIATPALAVRATYSKMDGVDELDLSNSGVELTVSKGFAILTPYAGVGRIYSKSEATGVTTLDTEKPELSKVFAGLNINLGVNIVLEADKTGDYTTYSAKVGFRF